MPSFSIASTINSAPYSVSSAPAISFIVLRNVLIMTSFSCLWLPFIFIVFVELIAFFTALAHGAETALAGLFKLERWGDYSFLFHVGQQLVHEICQSNMAVSTIT